MRRLVLAALLLASPAQAQQRPPAHPARDVAVTYLVTLPGAGGKPAEQSTARMQYAAAGQRMRVESSLLPFGAVAILDFAGRAISLLAPEQQRYVEMVLPHGAQPNLPPAVAGARFRRGGRAVVAGLACTEWTAQGQAQAQTGTNAATGCVTADGVVLRASYDHPRVDVVALRVAYGAQPAAAFAPPPSYQRLALPQLPGPRR